MVEDLGITLLQMMENAGRALANLTRIHLAGLERRKVAVLAGRGGNGGGGLAAARRLATWGAEVRVVLAHPVDAVAEVPRRQLSSLEAMGVPVLVAAKADSEMRDAEVILDALLGYSLVGPPRDPEAGLIRAANSSGVPVIALDLPSGLDPDLGTAHDPTVRAVRTLTLAMPKSGLLHPDAAEWVGELWLADISVPPQAYAQFGIHPGALFADADLIRLGGRM